LAEFSSILWFSPPLCVHRLLSVRASKPSDMPIDYKLYSFLRLHSDFRYNSLGSICTCLFFDKFHMYMSLFDYRYKCVSKYKFIKVELSVRQ
jgi:hypothetical protein